MPCELKGKQNLGSMDEYTDLFVTLASCNVLWKNKLQIKIGKKHASSTCIVENKGMEMNDWASNRSRHVC